MGFLKLKKAREKAITTAIKTLADDICVDTDADNVKKRAEAIKVLMDGLNQDLNVSNASNVEVTAQGRI